MERVKNWALAAITVVIFTTISLPCNATSFTGSTGARLDFFSDPNKKDFDAQLMIKSFFQGQINLTKNLLLRAEVSIDTGDLIDASVFNPIDSIFQIDEISLVWKQSVGELTNYLSIFVGGFEPIGSDAFLRHHFALPSITSKLTDNWLGANGSTIHAQKSVGASEVIQWNGAPIAFGINININHALDDSYAFNGSLRFATALPYFIFDLQGGVGIPMIESDNSFATVNRIYLSAGLNCLLGNRYTGGVFMQAGLQDLPIESGDTDLDIAEDSVYYIFEPRFFGRRASAAISLFYFPEPSIKSLSYGTYSTGAVLDVFSNDVTIKARIYRFGAAVGMSFPKLFSDFEDFKDIDKAFDIYSATVSPYFEADLGQGTLRLMLKLDVGAIVEGDGEKSFQVSLGYKTRL